MKAAKIDPQPGEKWRLRDGKTAKIIFRSPRMIWYREMGSGRWGWTDVCRLSTFARLTAGRLEP